MSDVILAAWAEGEELTLPLIERAITETGLPRASLRLRLDLDYEYADEGDDPRPVLQLVRDETEEERETREKLQQGLLRSNATILTDEMFRKAVIAQTRTEH